MIKFSKCTVLAGFILMSLGFNAQAVDEKLTLTGSSTIAPLALEMAKYYEKKHPGVRIDVQTGGSSRGISDARGGLADIGMVSRALKDEEKDLKGFAIAKDGIAIILNKKNEVASLTNEQIINIYTGKIKNWKEVGGKDAAIVIVNKAEGRSTLELFLHFFKLKNTDIKASVIAGDNEQAVKTVSGSPNSIGYVSIGTAEYDSTHGVPIKLLPMDGIPASIETVKTDKFPLSRVLNLVTKAEPTGLQKKFIEFAQSKEAYDLIKKEYFVPIEK